MEKTQAQRPARVVVCVAGGIAAYKAPIVVRECVRRGFEVRVVMTRAATRFVGETTFSGLLGQQPLVDMWGQDGEPHILLSSWADVVLVAPCTADLIAKLAHGFADDAVTATLISFSGPVLLAPGMHTRMWEHAATQESLAKLRARGVHFVGPEVGALASGESGLGRMAEPQTIVDALQKITGTSDFRSASAGFDLAGKHILISAGPTHEPIDPVRFIGNRSSGKMGYAIAEAALLRGARVTLVTGPVALMPPTAAQTIAVKSALEMQHALRDALAQKDVDLLVMTAAVADYRVAELSTEKRKKRPGEKMVLELIENPDILAEIGAARDHEKQTYKLVGFALETENLIAAAQEKLRKKKVDLIVANLAANAFEGDTNTATFVHRTGTAPLPKMSKFELSNRILDATLGVDALV